MRKHLAGVYFSNVLLMAFSLAWLILIFIPLLVATDHAMGLWYENNLVVLVLEAGICVVSAGWAASRIFIYMKRAIAKMRLEKKQCKGIKSYQY